MARSSGGVKLEDYVYRSQCRRVDYRATVKTRYRHGESVPDNHIL